MNDLELRPARPEDGEFLWRLYQATMADYVRQGLGLDDSQQKTRFDSRSDLSQTQIITLGGRDIGVLSVVDIPWGTFVKQIAILPEFQGRGIGTSLLRSLMAESARRGRAIGLAVLRCNPAWKLYFRLGFRIIGSNPTHYRMMRPAIAGKKTAI